MLLQKTKKCVSYFKLNLIEFIYKNIIPSISIVYYNIINYNADLKNNIKRGKDFLYSTWHRTVSNVQL